MTRLSELRSSLLNHSLFPPTTLARAIDRLGFIQADPIRCPARSQDLILRHRVKNYKAGDLEKRYPTLNLEENYTFAYGFLPNHHRDLLHPRSNYKPNAIERKVIEVVNRIGPAHPSKVHEYCGSKSVRNAWGGQSKLAKQALEEAHHHGLLRVAHRENGIRIYEKTNLQPQHRSPSRRFEELLKLTVNLFGPTSERFLMTEARQYGYLVPTRIERRKLLYKLIDESILSKNTVDGIDYLCPKRTRNRTKQSDSVKLLAPFDPIVRDRDRFEHLWGWTYRFEAYTPAPKRVRGYYALPLLWREDIIGWANAKVTEGHLNVEIGFERKPTNQSAFKNALEAEVRSFAVFLDLVPDAWTIRFS
jgi:uncharacterized protein YcaQ